MSSTEITVPVPWGHIAAKAWGTPGNPRLLAIHGLNDNAGSFDQLMPLLQDQLYIICLDLPGHGLSSHFPPGLHFSLLDLACSVKLVVDHLNWTSFNILAHSMGSTVAIYFTALFGEKVTHSILIDGFFPIVIPGENFVQERCQVILEKFLRPVKPGMTYDFNGSITKLREERIKHISVHALRALQKRAFTRSDKGYVFNNDKRTKLVVYGLFTAGFHYGLLKCLDCPILMILTSEFEASSLSHTPTNQGSLALLSQTLGPKFKTVRTPGSHDVHMDSPTLLAPVIKHFLIHPVSHL
ncbi:serine hydrolase-like protein 2 [Macrosteles quadrilineatus]|uniref:serine hydrolase-like protein 2 n=1 Tax=Macrosteles quadrilineatus TaxID=74068 RepID=UPI0023E0A14C|nr:serine hydrolase-like protein 2 [Macrosteles quadrilineatus]